MVDVRRTNWWSRDLPERTVIVLKEDEARLLRGHLSPVPTFPSEDERSRRIALVEEICEALATYVIVNVLSIPPGGPTLYWSNTDGWGDGYVADTFTNDERLRLNLPVDGAWHEVTDVMSGSSQRTVD